MWSLPQLQSSRIILLRHVVFNRYYCILNGCYQTSLPSHTFLPALHHLSHSPSVNMSKCPSQHLEHSPSCPPRIYRKRWCSVCLVCLSSVCLWFWRSCTAVIKLTLCQQTVIFNRWGNGSVCIDPQKVAAVTDTLLSVALCRHPAAARALCITLFKSWKKLLALHWIMHCAAIQLTFSPLSFIILTPSFPFLPSPFSQQRLSVCQRWAADLTTNTLLRISAWASSDWTCKSWIRDTGVTGRTQSSEWDNHSLMHTKREREAARHEWNLFYIHTNTNRTWWHFGEALKSNFILFLLGFMHLEQ